MKQWHMALLFTLGLVTTGLLFVFLSKPSNVPVPANPMDQGTPMTAEDEQQFHLSTQCSARTDQNPSEVVGRFGRCTLYCEPGVLVSQRQPLLVCP